MNKWCGNIGFVEQVEDKPSVWVERCTERKYRGDFTTRSFKWNAGQKINDDISISLQLSVLADSYMKENLGTMRYITYKGSKWKITDISPNWPWVSLTIGELYNDVEEQT